jgi:CheY-like chemotaxis protein
MTKEISTKNIVLYADDDTDDLMLVRDAFNSYSDNVDLVTVTDGFQVLSYLKNLSEVETAPCLIILDINMPRMDGKETLINLRQMKRFDNVPAILFSTSSQPHDKEFAQKYGAGFLTKPIDYKQMDVIADQFVQHCSDEVKRKIRRITKE